MARKGEWPRHTLSTNTWSEQGQEWQAAHAFFTHEFQTCKDKLNKLKDILAKAQKKSDKERALHMQQDFLARGNLT